MEISSLEALIEERQGKRVIDRASDEKTASEEGAERERKEKEYQDEQNKKDQGARIGEADLSIFKRMGEETKILVVMCLAGILVAGLYFAMNSLTPSAEPKPKKNKRN